MKTKFNNTINSYFNSRYPFEFYLKEAKVAALWKKYKAGFDIISDLDKTLSYLRQRTNYMFYWYDNGCSIIESKQYSIESGWFLCMWCNIACNKKNKYKSCCSEECYIENRLRGAKRLSVSRLKYNPRDPIQYAKRHDISDSDAGIIVDKFVRSGSNLCPEYWANKGYSEESIINNISIQQKKNSLRHIDYWVSRGYSEDSAILEISNIQSKYSLMRMEKYTSEELKKFSPRCYEYWVEKGYSKADSINIVSNKNREYALYYVNSVSLEDRKKYNIFCIEYWIRKYPDCYLDMYKTFWFNKHNSNFRSKIADEFCLSLSTHFPNNKLYYSTTEYVKYINGVGIVKYDYVDLDNMVCIEFNGDYWHGNPNNYKSGEFIKYPKGKLVLVDDLWERDNIKKSNMVDLGFSFFTIWESDYKNDKELTINIILKEIKSENS